MKKIIKKNYQLIGPKKFLATFKGNLIGIKLKWGIEYRGKLAEFDSFMNLKIFDAEEWVKGVKMGFLGEIFIRCNNICFLFHPLRIS
mmetsp:Transcript_33839/g.67704  ORF Transcript_33839/g.67704 Transcript_33839/m.67704 type:complete len:87 (-) Transcript_33839:845-1105(-)